MLASYKNEFPELWIQQKSEREELSFNKKSKNTVFLYHIVYATEDFNHAAEKLFQLIQSAQKNYPGKRRVLFLNIEGHRNKFKGFDWDMFELQSHFLFEFLLRYLTEAHIPLGIYKNKLPQENQLPDYLTITNQGSWSVIQ